MNQRLLLGSALLVRMVSTQQVLAQKKKAQGQIRPNVVLILAEEWGYRSILESMRHLCDRKIEEVRDK